MSTIQELQSKIHALAVEKGWHEDRDMSNPHVVASMLCLIHSEVSEALECVRDRETDLWFEGRDGQEWHGTPSKTDKPCGFPSELADVVIRCLDMAEAMGIDLGKVIELKHSYNQTRSRRHGGKTL
jgi:NTP pyrophosphatase (non-canonical NTP hydrolase)